MFRTLFSPMIRFAAADAAEILVGQRVQNFLYSDFQVDWLVGECRIG